MLRGFEEMFVVFVIDYKKMKLGYRIKSLKEQKELQFLVNMKFVINIRKCKVRKSRIMRGVLM